MKIELFPPLSIMELGQRKNQEDAIAQWDNRLFVLCDGMGGHEHGEVASQTVCQSIVDWFSENVNISEPFNDKQLLAALDYAYTELDKKDDGNLRKMGTTLTLLYTHAQGITAAHIGDSRIYHIRNSYATGKSDEILLYQSRDHSLVFDLYQAGEITYDEMRNSPQKNIITRAMQPGIDNRVRPDIIHITDIRPGDWFYLCSDGMLEQMDDDELSALLTSKTTDEAKRLQLIDATRLNQDNHTAWLIHIKDVQPEADDNSLVNEEPTARCNALNMKRAHEDVVIATPNHTDEDDVVMVAPPPPIRRKRPIPLMLTAVLLCSLVIGVLAWWLLRPNEKPEPPMQVPITRDTIHVSDSTINIPLQKDSAKQNNKFNNIFKRL